ncbi:MAG: EAL domain-containing protein [Gammaproteobacteria bacterium]|nr:EAL domain-containing protein [Gammaproteobacteria bacterium]
MLAKSTSRRPALEPVIFLGFIIAFEFFIKVKGYSPAALTDLAWTVTALATGLRCWYTASQLTEPQRQAWRYLGMACLAWFGGMLVWDYQELVLGVATPFPSLSDIGFLGFAVLFIPGLMKMIPDLKHWSITLVQLSLIGIMVCCIAIAHIIIFSSLLTAQQHPSPYLVVALAYPVIYMSVLLFGITNQWRIVQQRRAYLLLLIGFSIHAITNSFYAYSLLGNTYQVGNAIDALWLIGFFFIYEAARQSIPSASQQLVSKTNHNGQPTCEMMIAPAGALLIALIAYQFQNQLKTETFEYGLPFALFLVGFIAIRERAMLKIEQSARKVVTENQSKLSTLVETIPYGVQENDLNGRITFSNRVHHEILGYPEGDLIGRYIWDMQPDESEKTRLRDYLKYIIEVKPIPTPYITTSRRADNGAIVSVKVDWAYKYDSSNRLTGFISVISDITSQQQNQEKLRQAAAVFENTDEAVMITNAEGEITSVNRAFSAITGYAEEEVIGKNPRLLRSHRHDENFYNKMWEEIKRLGIWRGEIWNRRKNGEVFPVWQTVSAIHDNGSVTHYVSVFSDISAIKDSEEKLNFLAYHDPLTELPNRLLMQDRLKQAIERADREKQQIAVMLIDLDHFKNVNDSLGHLKGDELLQTVAARLKEQVRKEDTVARLGGDEFVVILEDVHGAEDAARLATKFKQIFEGPTLIGNHQLHVTLSIGIALYPKDGADVSRLIKHADTALYRSKVTGRNNFHFYTEDLTAAALKRLTLESELRQAIINHEFILHYQPLINLSTRHITGVEALIRWQHPQRGTLLPEEFLSVAEETRLINTMGERALHEACRQFQQWLGQGYSLQRLAVNIAHAQLHQDNLVDILKNSLSNSGLPAHYLELEISENFMMEQGDKTPARLESLKALGVSLAIDDFGTGRSSLSYLKRLPLDRLKIDRSFISDIPGDTHDEVICRSIIGLAHNLGLSVIAEGVETSEQEKFIIALGCTEVQGFFYSKPVIASELECQLQIRH